MQDLPDYDFFGDSHIRDDGVSFFVLWCLEFSRFTVFFDFPETSIHGPLNSGATPLLFTFVVLMVETRQDPLLLGSANMFFRITIKSWVKNWLDTAFHTAALLKLLDFGNCWTKSNMLSSAALQLKFFATIAFRSRVDAVLAPFEHTLLRSLRMRTTFKFEVTLECAEWTRYQLPQHWSHRLIELASLLHFYNSFPMVWCASDHRSAWLVEQWRKHVFRLPPLRYVSIQYSSLGERRLLSHCVLWWKCLALCGV